MDVKVKVRFYNENFLLALSCAGYSSPIKFAEANGFSFPTIYSYIGFRSYPRNKKIIRRLEKALGVAEEYLFPPEYKLAVDKKHGKAIEVVKEVSLAQIETTSPSPRDMLEITEQKENVRKILDKLGPRQKIVIEQRFGLGENSEPKTLSEVGISLGIGQERVRQIEAKALRTLRHPKICREVADGVRTQNTIS